MLRTKASLLFLAVLGVACGSKSTSGAGGSTSSSSVGSGPPPACMGTAMKLTKDLNGFVGGANVGAYSTDQNGLGTGSLLTLVSDGLLYVDDSANHALNGIHHLSFDGATDTILYTGNSSGAFPPVVVANGNIYFTDTFDDLRSVPLAGAATSTLLAKNPYTTPTITASKTILLAADSGSAYVYHEFRSDPSSSTTAHFEIDRVGLADGTWTVFVSVPVVTDRQVFGYGPPHYIGGSFVFATSSDLSTTDIFRIDAGAAAGTAPTKVNSNTKHRPMPACESVAFTPTAAVCVAGVAAYELDYSGSAKQIFGTNVALRAVGADDTAAYVEPVTASDGVVAPLIELSLPSGVATSRGCDVHHVTDLVSDGATLYFADSFATGSVADWSIDRLAK